MAPAHTAAFGDLLNPQNHTPKGRGPAREQSVGPSLQVLNNHAGLSTPIPTPASIHNPPRTNGQRSAHGLTRTASGESLPGLEGRRRAKVKAVTTKAAYPHNTRLLSPPPVTSNTHIRIRSISPIPRHNFDDDGNVCSAGAISRIQHDGPLHPAPPDEQLMSRDLTPGQRECLDKMTEDTELDERHRQYARDLAEVVGDEHRRLAQCADTARSQFYLSKITGQVAALAAQMEQQMDDIHQHFTAKIDHLGEIVRDLADGMPSSTQTSVTLTPPDAEGQTVKRKRYEAKKELKALLFAIAVEIIPGPNLQAYTAVEDSAKKYLARSLFNIVKVRVATQDDAWKALHLPKKVRGVNDGDALRSYDSAIRDAGKHAREKLHLLLLTNIRHQKHGEVQGVAVPSLDALWHRIGIKCGVVNESQDVAAAWKVADGPTRTRLAYLRREAARLRKGPTRTDIWKQVDAQLEILRAKDLINPEYSTSFYDIIYQNDGEIFNGKRSWPEISRDYVLTLPSEEEILEGTAQGAPEDGVGRESGLYEMEQNDFNVD
ncbi:hypothetical protein DFH28DRAFT_1126613 [Melampsora americana]|nr:hypothetical protein DFH28DRAFT_1126613 [Melampsora americana]